MGIEIKEKNSGTVLAHGEVGTDAVKYEGNWYFQPEKVETSHLEVTDRTYTCPYKGTCNWVDYVGTDGTRVRDVAWVYPAPKAGHDLIKDRYGFYAGSRGPTQEAS
jgi:uncharacterized protein (DUF427 family)